MEERQAYKPTVHCAMGGCPQGPGFMMAVLIQHPGLAQPTIHSSSHTRLVMSRLLASIPLTQWESRQKNLSSVVCNSWEKAGNRQLNESNLQKLS